MSGPWEKYATPQQEAPQQDAPAGPWQKYQTDKPAPAPQGTPIPATGMQTADSGPVPLYTGTEADILPTASAIQGGKTVNPTDIAQRVANSITFGLADRLAAGVGSITGGPGYAQGLQALRDRTDQMAKEHPVAAAAADIGGAAMLPIGAIGAAPRGAGLLTKMGYGAGVGGVLGAASGAGNSRDWTDLKQLGVDTATGAVTGSLIGGSIPAVGAGVGKAYRAVADSLTKPSVSTSKAASRALDDAMRADGYQAIRSKLDTLGPEAMLPDAGPSLQGLGQGVALRPGDAKSTLVNALTERNKGTNGRLGSDINAALGPGGSAIAETNAIRAARSAEHQDLPAIFKDAPKVDVTEPLAIIGQRLNTAEGPEKAALLNLRAQLLEEKATPAGAPTPAARTPVVGPNGKVIRYEFNPAVDGTPGKPPVFETNAERLSNIKIATDKLINYGDPGLGIAPGALNQQQGALTDVRRAINEALRAQVPGYAAVMDKSSALARQADALERGTTLFQASHENHPDVFAQQFAKMTPEERAGLRVGNRAQIELQVGNKANDLVALKQALKGDGDWPQQNASLLYGKPNADNAYGALDREGTFRETYDNIVRNSQSAQRLASAKALADKEAAASNPNLTSASPTGLALAGAKKVGQFILGGINSENAAVRDSALAQLLSLKGPERDRLLELLMQVQNVGDRNAVTGGLIGNLVAGSGGTAANYAVQPNEITVNAKRRGGQPASRQ